jgi:transketolase
MLYFMSRLDPKDPHRDDRDRILISHGHTSPGAYTALSAAGFFPIEPVLHGFRQGGSPYEGHVERSVPGIEWDTGNLGQGLSAGIGKALYSRLSGQNFHTFVFMSDGEQQKGQVAEGRRFASKFNLSNLTVIMDRNRRQISGDTEEIMPQDLAAEWKANKWQVMEIVGHDLNQVYNSLHKGYHNDGAPLCIIANTVMGKGVSFMENDAAYHGAALKPEQLPAALKELGIEDADISKLLEKRKAGPPPEFQLKRADYPTCRPGQYINYPADKKLDNRSAFGNALLSFAESNLTKRDFVMAVFDCDLAGSVKTEAFAKKFPDNFFQSGVAEHNTAALAGSLSAEKAVSVWADFAAFGVDETYNQARLSDINHANLKLFCTHTGVNVGEDGKTHQSIDYFALLNSTFGWKVITPADPNQTDKIVRYVLTRPGNFAVMMGRAINPVITDESGKPFFGESYEYRYGRMDVIRDGEHLVLASSGNMLNRAFDAWNKLHSEGIKVALVNISDWCDLHSEDIKMLAAYPRVVVLEDHNIRTGLGTAIASAMFESGLSTKLSKIGVTEYASSGKPDELYKLLGMDADSVATRIRSLLKADGITVK